MGKGIKLKELGARGISMKLPMAAVMIVIAVVPMILQAIIMLGSFKQTQLDARSIEIQNQCSILSSRMTRSGYMTAEKKNNAVLDSQMQVMSDLYNGRIVLVNSGYRIIADTFNLATGKYYISEEVIKCFKGESISRYNKEMQYYAHTIPVYSSGSEKKIDGVIVVTASTENILSMTDRVLGKNQLFFMCMALLVVVLSLLAVHFLMRPFKRLSLAFTRVYPKVPWK